MTGTADFGQVKRLSCNPHAPFEASAAPHTHEEGEEEPTHDDSCLGTITE